MSQDIATLLAATEVPPELHAPAVYGALLAHALRQVERLGIRGQDAEAVCAKVLSALPVGRLDVGRTVTLERALRHRLHLEALHWWRAQRRRRRLLERAHGETARGPAATDAIVREEEKAEVRRAVARLPEADRRLLSLAYLSDLPLEEVRVHMGYRSREVLLVRLSQARKRLRDDMTRPGGPR